MHNSDLNVLDSEMNNFHIKKIINEDSCHHIDSIKDINIIIVSRDEIEEY